MAAGLDDYRIRAWAIIRGAYLGGEGVEARCCGGLLLEQDLQPGGLALAVEVRRGAGAALPLREHDPAQVRELDGDRGAEGGEELGVPHIDQHRPERPDPQ